MSDKKKVENRQLININDKLSDFDLVSLKCPQGVCSRLEEGVSNEEHFGRLLQDCHHKLTSLQERMSACQAPTESSAGLITALEVMSLK